VRPYQRDHSIVQIEKSDHLATSGQVTHPENEASFVAATGRVAGNIPGTQQTGRTARRSHCSILYRRPLTRPKQGVSYSIRSACMESMETARRAGIMAATGPETASKAQTDRIVIGSYRPTPKRNA
jgi:hypothetical protein